MGETRRKFDHDFREGAVRLVRETGKPIAQVARDLGVNLGTLGNWVNADKRRRGEGNGALDEDERAERARLLRQYFPKGTDLSRHSPDELATVAAALNGRPRKTLGWKTPAEALDEFLYSCQHGSVATTP